MTPLAPSSGDNRYHVLPMPIFVVVRRFRDVPDALVAWSALDSAGLESFLFDEITIRMDWLWSNALGGIRVCVRAEDAEEGDRILRREIPQTFNIGEFEEFNQPRCPSCESLDISFQTLHKPATYALTFLLGLPIQIPRRRWKCQSCGHVWRSI